MNGTAILVIAASVLAIVAAAKVTGLASNVAATMTDAILSRIDVDPRSVLAQLQGLATDVRGLAAAVRDAKATASADLMAQIDRLENRLGPLAANIARLNEGRSLLVDNAFAAIARALADDLEKLKGCRAPAPNA